MIPVDYATALRSSSHSANRWSRAHARLVPEVWPEFTPSFRLAARAKIFTIGSCFARNIESHVAALGYDVPMHAFKVPREEWNTGRPNGILNKYTPASIYQALNWTAAVFDRGGGVTAADAYKHAIAVDRNQYIDLDLGGFTPVSKQRLVERREEVFEVFSEVFQADCVVITPGLIETWFDKLEGLYLQGAPIVPELARQSDRWEFVVLDYASCKKFLSESIDLIRARNPKAKYLITASPVPMNKTFTADDVIVANMHAKCVLRAACGELVKETAEADYFPSFESVMLTRSWSIFSKDLIHPTDQFIGKIVGRLVGSYFTAASDERKQFQRACTLASGTLAEAQDALRIVVTLLEKSNMAPEYHTLHGMILLRLGLFSKAEASFKSITESEGATGGSWHNLGVALARQRRFEEAAEAFRQAVTLQPAVPRHRWRLAQCLMRAGVPVQAEAEARKACQLAPSVPRYIALLTKITESTENSPLDVLAARS